jgi:hypothetical protein
MYWLRRLGKLPSETVKKFASIRSLRLGKPVRSQRKYGLLHQISFFRVVLDKTQESNASVSSIKSSVRSEKPVEHTQFICKVQYCDANRTPAEVRVPLFFPGFVSVRLRPSSLRYEHLGITRLEASFRSSAASEEQHMDSKGARLISLWLD